MLRFNTFRARRYLRTRFVEGNFLLASEASDLELEILDLLRTSIRSTMGDVAVSDAWKVERLSDTSVLIKPGEAWFKGLPFISRYGKDQLVSGAILSLGSIPVGVTATDHPDGLGKVINFNDGSTTPTNNYRFVVTALEELVTDVDDPFLKNANLTESTGQKVRLNYQLNIVPVSTQTNSPTPYRDENSSSGGPITNYPDSGGTASPNYVNEIDITPSAGLNGEQVNLTVVTGSEAIDGRDVEIVLRNDPGLGGGNPIPNSPAEQQRFSNGKLIDSNGSEFHINAIFNDTISTQVVLRIDKEPGQSNPEIINTRPIRLIKRDVYTTDDVNGAPQGRVNWPIADVDWDSAALLTHPTKITDLRTVVEDNQEFQLKANIKDNLILAEGGDVSFDATSGLLTWTDAFQLLHPFGTASSISASSANMLDGASLVYELDLETGGAVEKGNVAINITTGGTTLTVDPITYDNLKLGNVVVDSGGTLTYITGVDPDTNQITVNDALVTGAGTIFQDQFASGQAQLSVDSFTLAARSGNRIYFYRGLLELEDGETSQVGDGVSSQLLAYIGATSESDGSPDYASEVYVTDGESHTTAISNLDAGLDSVAQTVLADQWKSPHVADFASLPAVGNIDGDIRVTLDTRIAYHWDDAQMLWLPLTGTGGGLKITGGGTISYDDSTNELSFTSDLYIERPGLEYEDNTIPVSESPITLPNDKDVAYVEPNLVSGGGNLSVVVDTLDNVPPTAQIIARRDDVLISSTENNIYEQNNSSSISNNLPTGNSLIGLTFTPTSSSSTVTKVEVSLRNGSGSPIVGTISASIIGTIGSTPDDTNVIATATNTFDGTDFSNSQGFYTFEFDNANLTAGTLYAVEIDLSAATGGSIDVYDSASDAAPSRIWWKNGAAAWQGLSTDDAYIIVTELNETFGESVIVGASSTRLAGGESTKLYDTITDQAKDKQRGADYGFFRSDNPVTWTGTELQFTSSITLETITRDGTEQEAIIDQADSPLVIPDGQWAWIEMDRNIQSQSVSFQTGTNPPAIPEAGKDVFVFGKRRDQGPSNGYLHLALHKQVLEPGQTVRLGASGAGGGSGDSFTETLKNRLNDSPFRAVFPYVAAEDQDSVDAIDPTSTGSYDLLSKTFRLGVGETLVSADVLDDEYTNNFTDLSAAELIVKYDEDGIDDLATYELSKDGGANWETVDAERIADTGTYRGIVEFDPFGSSTTPVSIQQTDNSFITNDDAINGFSPDGSDWAQTFTATDDFDLDQVTLALAKRNINPFSTDMAANQDSDNTQSTGLGNAGSKGFTFVAEKTGDMNSFITQWTVTTGGSDKNGLVNASLYSTSGGVPNTLIQNLGSIGTNISAGLWDTPQQYSFSAFPDVPLVAGTTYAIVFTSTDTGVINLAQGSTNLPNTTNYTSPASTPPTTVDGNQNTYWHRIRGNDTIEPPDWSFQLEIWGTTGGGLPDSGNVLGTSTNTLDASTLSTATLTPSLTGTPDLVDFNFSPISLVNGQEYAIVLKAPGTGNGVVWIWGTENIASSSNYADGQVYEDADSDGVFTTPVGGWDRDFYFDISGEATTTPGTLDLRVRITSGTADALVEGFGVLFDQITAESVGASTTEVRFTTSFNAVADNFNTFTLPFRPTEGLIVYLNGSGQSFTYGDFAISGNDIVFATDQFNNGGVEKVQTLRFVEPIDARFFDNSDLNRGLLVANHLSSTDGSNDAGVPGRGIVLVRPDGVKREITIDNNDNISIKTV
jgi:hypothetical protein